ncbi:MAG: response regulator receiver domain protein (CheY-like) [Holophagaceae bacterium]|nr:response regulator receiver domain protein (CheY-like) [Holophagaceae bacterium]
MLTVFLTESAALLRMVQAVTLFLLMAACVPSALRAGEPRIVALHNLDSAEVRHQGFTLPRATKVHVYAKGAGLRRIIRASGDAPLFAYGWILNATTREVVWQMDGSNTKRDWEYRVADQYLDLPAGSYEAYFANHGFGQSLLFAQWSRNIDRRSLAAREGERHQGFLAAFGADDVSLLRHWREQVGNYGMEIYLPGGQVSEVNTFEGPLRWKNIVVALPAATDDGHWTQAFHLRKPVTLHVYGEGEGSGRRMHDYGWILDARTRTRVWEMTMDKSQFAGGARKNRRQVETIQLPAGDYEATFITDDSHSPADWNSAPPCDPAMYGLTLALPADADLAAFTATKPLEWSVLAELVRVGNAQDRTAPFTLAAGRTVRIHAIAEADGDDMADEAWIEDAAGKRVWVMERSRTHHAGGASKNRLADELVSLPKGTYTLRFRTDESHAYGHWNSDAPWDAERYGLTVYAGK